MTAGWVQLEPELPEQVALRCWWARPGDRPPRGGVLVLPEVFGLNGWVRGVAERLAAEGYAALALPLFARTAPDLELGYGPDDLVLGRSHKDRTRTELLLADGALAARWLQRQLAEAAPPEGKLPLRRLGCVGFCFGGHVALLAATLPQVAASCDFYGAGVASTRPGGGPPSLELVPAIPGTLLCLCGRQDPLIPPADVEAIALALTTANAARSVAGSEQPPHRLMLLEGGHGFMCAARADHNPDSASAGWRAMLELFEQLVAAD